VVIAGNLTKEIDLRVLPSGEKVAGFVVATNRIWKDKNGDKQTSSEFHNIVVFGKLAEICGAHLVKGQSVLIEGRIQTRSWENQDKEKKYKTEIIAENVQFGSKPNKEKVEEEVKPKEEKVEKPEDDINPDDIPF
jgi:single-strand DNA-binding protein